MHTYNAKSDQEIYIANSERNALVYMRLLRSFLFDRRDREACQFRVIHHENLSHSLTLYSEHLCVEERQRQ